MEQETAALEGSSVTSRSNLKTLGGHSAELSEAYREAARAAQKGQDAAAVLTYIAATSFVSGAAGAASDLALANRAMVGVGSTRLAGRTVSKDAITGIYIASRRMNCVATTACMGGFLLDGSERWIIGMARAATFGAIEEIRIIAREALVRDVADFTTIRDALIAGATLSDEQLQTFERMAGDQQQGPRDVLLLNQYLKLLDNCLGAEGSVTAVEPVDAS